MFKGTNNQATASRMFTLKEGNMYFSPHENNNKKRLHPKSECIDDKVWEVGLGGFDSCLGPLGRVGGTTGTPSPSLSTPGSH